jgi:hypothetical protein
MNIKVGEFYLCGSVKVKCVFELPENWAAGTPIGGNEYRFLCMSDSGLISRFNIFGIHSMYNFFPFNTPLKKLISPEKQNKLNRIKVIEEELSALKQEIADDDN